MAKVKLTEQQERLKRVLRPIICEIINETSDSPEYGLKWQEFDKNDRIITKTKMFKSDDARKEFIKKLKEKDNFNKIVAYTTD